jgi:hypothetical protein
VKEHLHKMERTVKWTFEFWWPTPPSTVRRPRLPKRDELYREMDDQERQSARGRLADWDAISAWAGAIAGALQREKS